MKRKTVENNIKGTGTPAHNCRNCNSDGSYTFWADWKPFPFYYKGTVSCKCKRIKKHFQPERVQCISPVTQYISDRRPCGVTPQQLDSTGLFSLKEGGITLLRFLNGSAGYRTYSEVFRKRPGWYYRIQLSKVHKTVYGIHRDSRYMFGTEVYRY